MKALTGVLTFLGLAAIVVGLACILLSLRNMADLHVWFGLGMVSGVVGLVLLVLARLIHGMTS